MSTPSNGASAPAFDPSEKIYDDEFAESKDRLETYADFAAIVKQLRRDCPWDREQTHESVKHLLIEEAYEVVDAIDSGDSDELKKELGDVFLHVLFHSRISEENGGFTIQDVIQAETEKLVRRHPHVFGDAAAGDADEVMSTWEQIKQQERDEEGEDEPSSVLDGVPRHLPALLQALRMQEKAAGVGFDFPDADDAWEKVEEEIEEFREAVDSGDEAEREDEFGDVLFALVNYARYADVNPETALRSTNDKFSRRVRYIEQRLRKTGRTLEEVTLAEADALWNEAKNGEENG
ncbi:nucleoside triphosphate pyrophosphohydrolase [Longibacter salinarum]|uniref:Nucleoside triphosphate pyrophosphohydrolase n=1 Tax=Longibacter salinarum TaxID=1850348 RepID=A0A2A8D1S8_9BACT|nr:nucleoside triphosphate pyrophosphohydrolase [Longibacter salinarum]PEN14909.1 nucleoside triphosphate pyrophosphohydrolase [Longibacter salinarum]